MHNGQPGMSVPAVVQVTLDLHCHGFTDILLQVACRGDHQSPESLDAVHEGEHRSDQDEREDTERREEVTFEEGAL
jgi:hypothetical protein